MDHPDAVISGGEGTKLTGLAVSPSGTQFCVADDEHFVKVGSQLSYFSFLCTTRRSIAPP